MKRPTLAKIVRAARTGAVGPIFSVIIALVLLWCGSTLVNAADRKPDTPPKPIILRYLGMQQARVGEPFVLKARLRDAATSAPLSNQWVQFQVAGQTIPALTDRSGLAMTKVVLPPQAAPDVVTVTYLGPERASVANNELMGAATSLSITQPITAPLLTPAVLIATLAPGQTVSESKRALLPGDPQPTDLVFSFDSNQSMGQFLEGVKGVAVDTVEALTTDGFDVRFAVVSHRDYPAAYQSFGYESGGGPVEYHTASGYPYRLDQALTITKSALFSAVNAITVDAGGDPPASYSRVLYESVAELMGENNPIHGPLGYRTNAVKLVALFGDDLPHDNDLNQDIPGAVGVDSTGGDPGRDGIMQETSNPANIGVGNDDLNWQAVLDQMHTHRVSLLAMQLTSFYQARWSHWAERTGGELTPDYDVLQTAIRSRILSGGRANVVTLRASNGYDTWLSIQPAHYLSVALPADLAFQVSLTPPPGTAPGVHHFTVDLTADDAVLASQSVTITVIGAPDLQVTKHANTGGRVSPGQQLAYTLHYTNAGNIPAMGVVLTETVPAHTTFAISASSPNWMCAQNGVAGAQCIYSVGALVAGATGQVAFAVTLDNPLPPNTVNISNTVSIGADQGTGADSDPNDNTGGVVTLVNHPPAAVSDTFSVDEDSVGNLLHVLANDTDPDLDPLAVIAVSQPAHGVASMQANKVVYTPIANFNGGDSFSYTISDGVLTATASVALTVQPLNDSPTAANDSFTVEEGSVANLLDVLANDQDIDGDSPTVIAVGSASHGATALVGGTVRYTPAAGYVGGDAFSYTISDGQLQASANVAVIVTPRQSSTFALSVNALPTGANSDGVITVGQLATVTVVLTNTGQVTLTTTPVSIAFASAVVTPVNIQPAPSQSSAGQLNWQNLLGAGTLAPGQRIQAQIVFQALANTSALPGQVTVVQGHASGVVDAFGRILAQKSAQSQLRITKPSLALTTAVVGSNSQSLLVGGVVTFTIRLHNMGDTTITRAPLTDQFPNMLLGFVRASAVGFTLSNDGDVGRVEWADLTEQVGDMGPGQQVEIQLTYRLLAAAPTISRQATVSGARDQFGDPLANTTATATVLRVSLQMTITATPPAGSQITPGGVVSYEVALTNSGGVTLTQIEVEGVLTGDGVFTPAAMHAAEKNTVCPLVAENQPSPTKRVWMAAQLAPGAACTVAVQARMAQTPQQGVMMLAVNAQAEQMSQPVIAQSSHTAAPLSPGVESFTAVTDTTGIRLEWVTRAETGLSGFHIWRGSNTERAQAVRVTNAPIPVKGIAGSSYDYSEMPPLFDATFFYWLEVISNQGSVDVGPLGVSLPAAGRIWLPLIQRAAP